MFISVISMAYLTLQAFIEHFQCVRHWEGVDANTDKVWAMTASAQAGKGEYLQGHGWPDGPYAQRSYKLEIMAVAHLRRVLCSLQGTFREYHNAIDHGYYSSVFLLLSLSVPSASGNGSSERLKDLSKFTQLVSENTKPETGSSVWISWLRSWGDKYILERDDGP